VARLALTGTASFLGGRLLRRLVAERGARRGARGRHRAAADDAPGRAPPDAGPDAAGADRRLVELFREEDVDTVFHAAFFTTPRRDTSYAHELESIGTLHLAAACGRGRRATPGAALVHGGLRSARPEPELPDRGQAARLGSRLAWVRDKAEAESTRSPSRAATPGLGVSVLRFAPLLGPGVHTFYTRLLSKRAVAVLLGLRPAAAAAASGRRARRGDAVARARAVAGRECRAAVAADAPDRAPPVRQGHAAGAAPGRLSARGALVGRGCGRSARRLPRLRALPVRADGAKARRTLDFEARYSSREALEAFLAYRYPEARRPAAAEPAESEAGRERARRMSDTGEGGPDRPWAPAPAAAEAEGCAGRARAAGPRARARAAGRA
jgi:UDP-glucose 4-epimerase